MARDFSGEFRKGVRLVKVTGDEARSNATLKGANSRVLKLRSLGGDDLYPSRRQDPPLMYVE
jgi:hypothetical protein